MVFQLSENEIYFPKPELADQDGLLAVGGDLTEERLLLAYANGIFPWYNFDEPILWYAPHRRCVIFPEKVKVSKSMQQLIKKGVFRLTVNQCFDKVITQCALIKRKNQEGTWINKDMIDAYTRLYQNGWAHSVEVWENNELVGGLYGIGMGKVFCGESMFSFRANASKLALIYLCHNLPFLLVDCQIQNSHLLSMGAELMSMKEYQTFLP